MSSASQRINSPHTRLRPSATLAINEKCAQLRRAGRVVYKLGFGQSPFPVPDSVVAALRANAFQKDYLPVRGLPELRVAVAEFHRRFHGLTATSDDILIGPGSKELIFLAQMVHQANLLLPSPSWVSYEPQAQLLGLKTHWMPTRAEDGWLLQPDELEKACRTVLKAPRLLILNYPNNPTGTSYDAAQLSMLAEVARRHDLLIISDEIYAELHHKGEHISLARFYPEGTIVSGGLSKWCGAGGWRLGTMCFPPEFHSLKDAMACAASETFSAVAAPIQFAAIKAFERDEEIEDYVQQSRRILRSLGRQAASQLRARDVNVDEPYGAFYLFPDFGAHRDALRGRGVRTSAELCERLLEETGVALLPGSDFGRPADEFTCRLAYVDFDGASCLAAARQVPPPETLDEQFLREYCGNVLTAVDLIGDWLGDS